METVAYIKCAQMAQNKLKQLNLQAEHIYLIKNTIKTALVFVNHSYENLDFYTKNKIASQIRNGPLFIDFYLISPQALVRGENSIINTQTIYNSKKIFGRKPLKLGDFEYASPKDYEYHKDRLHRSTTS